MNLRFILAILVFSTSFLWSKNSQAQRGDTLQEKILSPEEMIKDLSAYKQLLLETHPGLFRYMSREKFDIIIQEILDSINTPTPFYTFYRHLARLNAEIRCAHSNVLPGNNFLSYLRSSCETLPFYVYPIDNKLYILFNGTTQQDIVPGDELLSINGMPVKDIRHQIESYYFRDGTSASTLQKFLQGGTFSMFFYLFIDQPHSFEISIRKQSGTISAHRIQAQSYELTEKNYINNPVNKDMMKFYGQQKENWVLEILPYPESTAYLRIMSFSGKNIRDERSAKMQMEKFMAKVIRTLEQKDIKNLILELRGNPGGWDIHGRELLSYLLKKDSAVLYYRQQKTITKDSEFLKYSDLNPEDLSKADKYLVAQVDRTFLVDSAHTETLRLLRPKKQRFSGSVFIIVDEQCASSCAEFVAVAKANKIATLVGVEAGGAYSGGNGGSFIHFTLPESGIVATTPLVRYEMAVPAIDQFSMGTLPDYVIPSNLIDILKGRDTKKEFVLKLIKEQAESSED